jgi:hypothetical protein
MEENAVSGEEGEEALSLASKVQDEAMMDSSEHPLAANPTESESGARRRTQNPRLSLSLPTDATSQKEKEPQSTPAFRTPNRCFGASRNNLEEYFRARSHGGHELETLRRQTSVRTLEDVVWAAGSKWDVGDSKASLASFSKDKLDIEERIKAINKRNCVLLEAETLEVEEYSRRMDERFGPRCRRRTSVWAKVMHIITWPLRTLFGCLFTCCCCCSRQRRRV